MQIREIVILGGTGFVGRTLANQLYQAGYAIKVLTRNREARRRDLLPIPSLTLVQADIHDQAELNAQLAGGDAVINLVGILNERGGSGQGAGEGFRHAHVQLSEKIIAACQHNHIRRLLQMSALNADAATGSSHYLRSKGEAEDRIHAADNIDATSFRPSVIFGPGDAFFNRFAHLLKVSPLVFPLACAEARFAPVYVGDVARAFVQTLHDPTSYGQRYALCGPRQYTLLELVTLTRQLCGLNRLIIPLPDVISRLQGLCFDLFGFCFTLLGMEKPFSTDNYLSTKTPSIAAENGLLELHIEPKSLEGIVAQYMSGTSTRNQYDQFRQQAKRG